MLTLKHKLLAATIVAGAAVPAQAQFSFPATDFRGVGASAVADINVKVLNCIGVNGPIGNNNGLTSPVTNVDFLPSAPSTSNPELRCSAADDDNNNIYNGTTDFTGRYVSTGSGFGRQQWREFVNQFGVSNSNVNPFGTWPNIQHAFSEAPASLSDLTDYNTDSDAAGPDVNTSAIAGKAIQIPLYVVPIAFAYNPRYGTNGATPLNFRVKLPQSTNGTPAGGLRLSKDAYCKIWNGTIKNWNAAELKALNGGQDLRSLDDPQARWDSEGVPIRLVGRADRSGTTDLFTRALAAQCGGVAGNKFLNAAESLPYDNTSTIDIRKLRSDTHYFPNSGNPTPLARFAGTTQSLNGYVYDRVTNQICLASAVLPAVAGPPAVPAQCPGGSVAPAFSALEGLFMVADTSGGVELGVKNADSNLSLASSTAGVTLNGKFGYIGADFVAGSSDRELHSAALQEGVSGTVFLMPNSKNATEAFGTVLPPQTIAKTGAWDVSDNRQVFKDLANPSAGTELNDRTNPLHWVNILYPQTGATLANPAAGYPVTGGSNLLTYTCFSDAGKRAAITNYLGYITGKATKKNALAPISTLNPALTIKLSANTFKGAGTSALGVLAKSNIALPSSGWLAAYAETFLKKSTKRPTGVTTGDTLGDKNLWIHSKFPTKATDIDAYPDDVVDSNPTCASLPGA